MELVFEKSEVKTIAVNNSEILKQVVTYIEARYWITGVYPDAIKVNEEHGLNFPELRQLLPQINQALTKRELPLFDPERKPSKLELDPSFVIAVNYLVDISDKRSKTIKLKAVGLSTTKFNILLKNPLNKHYYETRAEEAFRNVSPVAKTSLGKLVEVGDLQAIKYYHEFVGEHDPNKEINNNINKLISLFMEILIKHVPKDTVDAISREFDVKLLELN